MRTINTAQLKNHTNQILRALPKKGPVLIKSRGKIIGFLESVSEKNLPNFFLLHHPDLAPLLSQRLKDLLLFEHLRLLKDQDPWMKLEHEVQEEILRGKTRRFGSRRDALAWLKK